MTARLGPTRPPTRGGSTRRATTTVRAQQQTETTPAQRGTPAMESSVRWAGEKDVLSKIVNAAISNAVLYEGIMKPMARRTLIKTVRGPWCNGMT